jgi:multidrug efflux pump subunit AcrB
VPTPEPLARAVKIETVQDAAADANQARLQYLPHVLVAILLLFIWQFHSFRKLIIVVASIPFMLIGVAQAP